MKFAAMSALLLCGCSFEKIPHEAYTAAQTIAAKEECEKAGMKVVYFESLMYPGVAQGHQCRPKTEAE
jgi:hypothetical protein